MLIPLFFNKEVFTKKLNDVAVFAVISIFFEIFLRETHDFI